MISLFRGGVIFAFFVVFLTDQNKCHYSSVAAQHTASFSVIPLFAELNNKTRESRCLCPDRVYTWLHGVRGWARSILTAVASQVTPAEAPAAPAAPEGVWPGSALVWLGSGLSQSIPTHTQPLPLGIQVGIKARTGKIHSNASSCSEMGIGRLFFWQRNAQHAQDLLLCI